MLSNNLYKLCCTDATLSQFIEMCDSEEFTPEPLLEPLLDIEIVTCCCCGEDNVLPGYLTCISCQDTNDYSFGEGYYRWLHLDPNSEQQIRDDDVLGFLDDVR